MRRCPRAVDGGGFIAQPTVLTAAYERHVDEVRRTVGADRLLEWHATDGWEPICHALDLPVPADPFPWDNRRQDW